MSTVKNKPHKGDARIYTAALSAVATAQSHIAALSLEIVSNPKTPDG